MNLFVDSFLDVVTLWLVVHLVIFCALRPVARFWIVCIVTKKILMFIKALYHKQAYGSDFINATLRRLMSNLRNAVFQK